MKKTICVAVLGLIIVLATFMGMRIVTGAVERDNMKVQMRLRDEYEKESISEIKGILEEYGLRNSGVNLTKSTEDREVWDYSLVIYNDSLKYLSESDKMDLAARLDEIKLYSEDDSLTVILK